MWEVVTVVLRLVDVKLEVTKNQLVKPNHSLPPGRTHSLGLQTR